MAAPGTLVRISPDTAAPRPYRGVAFQLWHWFGRIFLRLGGWRAAGDWPADRKMVVIAAPHTSNWDGIWMLAVAGAWRVRLRYMGKKSLTEGPFGWLVKWSGCVPIDRSRNNDVVRQMADAFAASEDLILVVPPEGTRGAVDKWKSGFYHIAVAAGVPLGFATMDYRAKAVHMAAIFWPTGDYEEDLNIIQSFYRHIQPRHAANFNIALR
jgi:1-acyl-sn-glycerol-3-phosphate acyltransferase